MSSGSSISSSGGGARGSAQRNFGSGKKYMFSIELKFVRCGWGSLMNNTFPSLSVNLNVEKRISLDEVSIVSEDRLNRGLLAPGRGRSAPRSPSPWARTSHTEVSSPMGEDDPRRGHLAHGRGRPSPRSPRPWARTTRTEVTSTLGKDQPPVPKPCILV
ncbi:hypothetical protein F2Q69_00020889 [Brassica cretica]|uniref:Uncharacterized protein n=1 Tax=Brassica cretica TaxID=69181 RepID=A0A8S9QC53_BRACR|nr:hypothetical protein F2Q69_00020889 [Brassica cretica]